MDPMDPNVGDIFTEPYYDELVVVTARWSNQIEIEGEDEVPIVYTMKRWWELVKEGIYV